MTNVSSHAKRLFVLDTNVLLHDPFSLFSFEEHDIFLPMMVLEELDNHKKGHTDLARNAREVLRNLSSLLENRHRMDLISGVVLGEYFDKNGLQNSSCTGRLFFQVPPVGALNSANVAPLNNEKADNKILSACLYLKKDFPNLVEHYVTLVTKDINLRVKSAAFGCHSEDYLSDKVVDDLDHLHSGIREIGVDYFSPDLESWREGQDVFYRVACDDDVYFVNECLSTNTPNGFNAIVSAIDGNSCLMKYPRDYFGKSHSVWGMTARNNEQNFAMNFLMDAEIDLVTLLGPAGTGKTLLALASGLEQTIEQKRYDEIIITRATIPLGEDIGFLPGTEEEKMLPWMGAINDNIEALLREDKETPKWKKESTTEMIMQKIKIKSMAFMRGRTFQNKYIIIDEAQNLTAKQMKALVTRVGVNSKIVCIGNLAQIDTPYLSAQTSGLTYLVNVMKGWKHSAHITLQKGERSRLANYCLEVMI
jgi:PhoH-like ATPase